MGWKNFPFDSTQVVGVLLAPLYSKPVDFDLSILVDLRFATMSLVKNKHSLCNLWVLINYHNNKTLLFCLGGLRIPKLTLLFLNIKSSFLEKKERNFNSLSAHSNHNHNE